MNRTAFLFLGLACVARTAAAQTAREPRRIVTGHSPEGRAVVVAEGVPATTIRFETLPGMELIPLWATVRGDGGPATSADPEIVPRSLFPAPGETRFLYFRIPSASQIAAAAEAGFTPEDMREEIAAKVPDLAAAFDEENPALHATQTVDYVIVLRGRVALELDDGAQVELRPGDSVIQNGTRHAWHNVGEGEALLAAVIVGERP